MKLGDLILGTKIYCCIRFTVKIKKKKIIIPKNLCLTIKRR